MLTLFALSITPKIAIHALVAHHTDTHLALNHDKTDQINSASFHCNVDNLVVELPYLSYSISIPLVIPELFRTYQIRTDHQFYSSNPFIFRLRGPPVTV
jgi:hypothetical protein